MVRSLSVLLLRPAVAALNRLRLAHKLVVIALVLIAPALYATWQFRSQQNAQIAFSSKERIGLQEIVPAGQLLTELANARALAVRSAGGDAEAIKGLPLARRTVAHAVAGLDAADGRLGGGERRRGVGVAPGGADGQRLRRGEVREQALRGHDLVDAHALLGAEGDLGVLLRAELPRGVERRRDEHQRDDDELVRQAQTIERRDGRAQEQGRQGTEDHAKVFGWRAAVLERFRRPA